MYGLYANWTSATGESLFPGFQPDADAAATFTYSVNGEPFGPGLDFFEYQVRFLSFLSLPRAQPHSKHYVTSNKEYESNDAPILAVHVTLFKNQPEIAVFGISIPHGVFDATGIGMVVHALDAELSGREWTPPPFPSSLRENKLEKVLESLLSASVGNYADGEDMIRDFVPATWVAWLWMLASIAYEYFWHRVELRVIYLGEDVVEKVVEPIKEAARKEGTWVSSGDALVEWLVKVRTFHHSFQKAARRVHILLSSQSIYVGSSSPNSLAVSSVFSIRPVFPTLGAYPHNAAGCFSIPLIPISTLSSPLISSTLPSKIAQSHRSSLNKARTASGLKSVADVVGTRRARVMRRGRREDDYIFTNQSIGKITELTALGGLKEFFVYGFPMVQDHAVAINKLNGGYHITATLRKDQWAKIEEGLKKLQ
ncbi:hypothetical protein P7C70_g954, partial [Phenoliferia sp. Uapishka_3]